MIDHKYKCIFVHQRKCAGTSIIASFGLNPRNPNWHYFNDGILSEEPWSWNQVRLRYPDYFVVSAVRNPWDRFVSGWKYCSSTRHRTILDVLRDMPTEGHDFRHVTRPQTAILFDEQAEPVFHDLLRFESLQADFDRVCDRIGKPRNRLPHLNRTTRSDYRTYFDSEAQEIFAAMFEKDIALLNYSF